MVQTNLPQYQKPINEQMMFQQDLTIEETLNAIDNSTILNQFTSEVS